MASEEIAAQTPGTPDDQSPLSDPDTEVRKRELIDRVAQRSGMKKRDVKPMVEAMLSVMGQALSDGEELNLQPFGKLRVARRKDLANGQVLTVKLRRSGPSIQQTAGPENGQDGLAETGQDG